jgi:hypothetical protein
MSITSRLAAFTLLAASVFGAAAEQPNGAQRPWSGTDDLLKLIRSESVVLGPLVNDLGIRIG